MLPTLGAHEELAFSVWAILGCDLDWQGLQVVCEVHDLRDPEILIAQLVAIRNNSPSTKGL